MRRCTYTHLYVYTYTQIHIRSTARLANSPLDSTAGQHSSGLTEMCDKYCVDRYHIYYIHSLNKGGGLRPPHLFYGFLS